MYLKFVQQKDGLQMRWRMDCSWAVKNGLHKIHLDSNSRYRETASQSGFHGKNMHK